MIYTRDKVEESCVIVLLKLMYLKTLIHAIKMSTATALLYCICQKPRNSKSGKMSGLLNKSSSMLSTTTVRNAEKAMQTRDTLKKEKDF